VPRRIAAIHFQLAIWHDDSRAELDMVSAKLRAIAHVGYNRNIAIPIGFQKRRRSRRQNPRSKKLSDYPAA